MTTNHSMGYFLIGGRLEHVVIAEKALGHALPPKAEIHHFDENKKNNRPGNLVICPDRSYHVLLHMRAKALKACGDASKRRCVYCKTWDQVDNLTVRKSKIHGNEHRHKKCHALAESNRKLKGMQ